MENTNRQSLLDASNNDNIALIYSRSDLNEYFLELLAHGESNFVHDKNDLKLFHSISEVTKAAEKHGCRVKYVCLDNTYDECGGGPNSQRFSYLPLENDKTK